MLLLFKMSSKENLCKNLSMFHRTVKNKQMYKINKTKCRSRAKKFTRLMPLFFLLAPRFLAWHLCVYLLQGLKICQSFRSCWRCGWGWTCRLDSTGHIGGWPNWWSLQHKRHKIQCCPAAYQPGDSIKYSKLHVRAHACFTSISRSSGSSASDFTAMATVHGIQWQWHI